MNPEFQALADELYRERVLRARRTPPEERILQGPQLFDMACEASLAGIRARNAGMDEAALFAELRRRIRIGRQMEDRVA